MRFALTLIWQLTKEFTQHLEHQIDGLDLAIALKAVSIVRYVTDHITNVPLSCMTRLLNTHGACACHC